MSLARLGTESGGRFTERTNDLALGVARAQRDLGCIYSVGFYDDDPKQDRAKTVTVRVRRPGLRSLHPSAYIFRSVKAKRESLLRAAYLSPELFQTGVVRAHVFPVRPKSRKVWDALLALSFPVPLLAHGPAEREFGAILQRGSVVVHRFNRRVRLEPHQEERTSEPLVTFLERLDLEPGKYSVTAVLTDPRTAEPHSVRVEIEVPEIPRRSRFLIGPILGRRAGSDLVVQSGGSAPSGGPAKDDTLGDWNSFQPLLVQHVDAPTDLVAWTQACFVGKLRRDLPTTVARSFRRSRGEDVGTLEPVGVKLEGGEQEISCASILDVLPLRALRKSGDYVFGASITPASEDDERGEVRFSVGEPLEGSLPPAAASAGSRVP